MIRRAVLLVLACACGPAAEPAPAASPAASHPCPEGSSWNGTLCVREAAASAPSASASPPPPPPPSEEARVEARQRFMNATRFFSQGDYAHALVEFQAAYELVPVPAVLYNIAVTFEQLGRAREALDTYVEYRASGLPAARQAEVNAKIARLKQALGVP